MLIIIEKSPEQWYEQDLLDYLLELNKQNYYLL